LPPNAVYFGEVSLSGAIRPVPQAAARLKEAAKLGFTRAIVPEAAQGETGEPGVNLRAIRTLATLVEDIVATGQTARRIHRG
jgi:DNA repair protein RadA/Sms